jgi:hypothetical protein
MHLTGHTMQDLLRPIAGFYFKLQVGKVDPPSVQRIGGGGTVHWRDSAFLHFN